MKIAIYSGMFDPFHEGHRAVVNEASLIFDEVHVIIGPNPTKTPLFTPEERKAMIADIHFLNVKVDVLKEPNIIAYAQKLTKDHQVTIIRGIRNEKDFYYESSILQCMRSKAYRISFVHFLAEEHLTELSSTKVKDWCRQGRWECVDQYVPKMIAKALFHKFWHGDWSEFPDLQKEYERVKVLIYGSSWLVNTPEVASIFETGTAGIMPFLGGWDCNCFSLREKPKVDDDQSLQQIADGGDHWTVSYQPSKEIDHVHAYFKKATEAGIIQLPKMISAGNVREMLDCCSFDPIFSLDFYLMQIPVHVVNSTGNRYLPHTTSVGPIIVDRNFFKSGHFLADRGPLLILEGKHRWMDAVERGDALIWAYVGEEAIEYLKDAHPEILRLGLDYPFDHNRPCCSPDKQIP